MKSRIVASLIVATAAFYATAAPAQARRETRPLPPGVAALGAVTTEDGSRFRLLSRAVGKPFIVDVVRIDAGAPPGSRLPVVFVTDNDIMTTIAPAVARLGVKTFQLPPMIVVGIGYDNSFAKTPAEAAVQGLARRATDFTPVHNDAYLANVGPVTRQIFGIPWPADAPLGKSDAFLEFINKELKPFVAARFPANIDDSTLVGDSLGGLFALHVLFTSPDSFSRYVALSPDTSYGKDVLFREEAALGNVNKRLFMGIASQDNPEIAEATPRLDAQIRAHARPGLIYTYKVFADETHESLFPAGIMAGLRAVFDRPSVFPGQSQGGDSK